MNVKAKHIVDRTEEEIQESRRVATEYSTNVDHRRKLRADNNIVYMCSALLSVAFLFATKYKL